MAAGTVPQQPTTTPAEGSASVASGGSSAAIDLVQLFSSALQQYVARQVMVVGDPTNQSGFATVKNTQTSGGEFALTVQIQSGSQDLQLILAELRDIRAELQQLNYQLGAQPATSPPVMTHIDLNA